MISEQQQVTFSGAQFWAIRVVFMMEAVTLGAWLPRIPDIKSALDLDAGELGLALVGLPAGTLLGFTIAARFAQIVGLKRACMISGSIFALVFIAVGFAGSLTTLFGFLAICGFVVALLEVAMNTKAGRMEGESGRRIMAQCHGFWSIGTVVGALIGGAFAQAGASPLAQFMATNPIFAAVALGAAMTMSRDRKRAANGGAGQVSFFTMPAPALLLLCLMPVGIMGVEGAMMDWSAVFVRELLNAEPGQAAMVYAVFATLMAGARFTGDSLATRYGAANVVLLSSVSAAIGVGLFAAAPNLAVAVVGAALAGYGSGSVYPLAVSAAAAAPGRSPEANVAAVSFIAFSIFLAGPPLIGGLADLFGLRTALAILIPAALASAALSGRVRPQHET